MSRIFFALATAVAIIVSYTDASAMAGGSRHRRGASANGGLQGTSDGVGFQVSNTPGTTIRLPDSEDSTNPPMSSVPEPRTLVLLASGIAGLWAWMRRRG